MSFSQVWAIGRNYADHAKELNNEVPTSPIVFLKNGYNPNSAHQNGVSFPFPVSDIHYELELALFLGPELEVQQFALALDLTHRQNQSRLKSQGHPWTLAKAFKNSLLVSDWIPAESLLSSMDQLELQLWEKESEANERLLQQGFVFEMIFPIPVILEHLKAIYPLSPGDIVLTGTPAGVGPLKPNVSYQGRLLLDGQILLKKEWKFK